MHNALTSTRYSHVAIVLHWLIAVLIIAMLAAGKFMTSLEETSALRFDLTQWHKSFGLTLLLLSVFRLVWRLTHRPPAPATIRPAWERFAASLTHFLFYFLLLFLPISGWLMVSASPLNISTFLFDLVRVPHLPIASTASNRAELAELFNTFHEYASGILIVLLLLHIAAALRHQFGLKDAVLTRMTPDFSDGRFADGARLLSGILFVAVAGTWLLSTAEKHSTSVTGGSVAASKNTETVTTNAGDENSDSSTQGAPDWVPAKVNYTMVVMGDELQGSFSEARVQAQIDTTNPQNSILNAVVQTGSGSTGSPQIDDSLPGADWFHVALFPEASFNASTFESVGSEEIKVTGKLTIRNVTNEISFPLTINEETGDASGGFTINRLDFKVGASEQPDDSHAAFNVLIEFNFKNL